MARPAVGHLYQGRFKSFPIAADEHLLTVSNVAPRGGNVLV
jgi:hypothetical protein